MKRLGLAILFAAACAASGGGGNGGGTGGHATGDGSGGRGSGGNGNPGSGGSNDNRGTGGVTAGSGGSASPGSGGNMSPGSGGNANAGSGGDRGSGGNGNPGSGGNGNSGSGGNGNPGSGGRTGAGGATSCGSLPLCDDFESTAVGAAPSSTLWTIIPTATSGTATVDSMGAHGSGHSLKVVSPDRLYLRNTSVIGTLGNVVHVRFYVRFSMALATGHGAMIVTHPMAVDQYSQQNELRFGSQDNVFHWNTDSDAANIPDVGPGDAMSFKPAANTWYCIELTINTGGNLGVAIDGADVPGLDADGTPTPNVDQAWISSGTTSTSRYAHLADFNFGWQSYGSGAMTLWFDDVALSSSPIGCSQ